MPGGATADRWMMDGHGRAEAEKFLSEVYSNLRWETLGGGLVLSSISIRFVPGSLGTWDRKVEDRERVV